MQANVILTIKDISTTVPYPASEREGDTHPGFKNLKGNTDAVEEIPAVQESNALRHALTKINSASTPFFTIASKKVLNNRAGSFWSRGYLEFAFNHMELSKDSPNYFLLFEQFNHVVTVGNFDLPVDFNFELRAVDFSETGGKGYSACVWITTAEFPNEEGAEKLWNMSIGFLADFLAGFEKPPLKAIYGD